MQVWFKNLLHLRPFEDGKSLSFSNYKLNSKTKRQFAKASSIIYSKKRFRYKRKKISELSLKCCNKFRFALRAKFDILFKQFLCRDSPERSTLV